MSVYTVIFVVVSSLICLSQFHHKHDCGLIYCPHHFALSRAVSKAVLHTQYFPLFDCYFTNTLSVFFPASLSHISRICNMGIPFTQKRSQHSGGEVFQSNGIKRLKILVYWKERQRYESIWHFISCCRASGCAQGLKIIEENVPPLL